MKARKQKHTAKWKLMMKQALINKQKKLIPFFTNEAVTLVTSLISMIKSSGWTVSPGSI